MFVTLLPGCSSGHKHVLVVEESLNSIILELHNREKGNESDAKYFLPLPESHPLIEAIFKDNNRLRVEKAEIRKNSV
ncbi:hypothetical protein K9M47_01865 [Candidatus Gracilibacteria bacterium]|nr:hypothetical protein [Candidatus Gracilibacteria bacterium]MCF7898398.1 hypothetical protein [Candidatus Paceibacterota bacterium]